MIETRHCEQSFVQIRVDSWVILSWDIFNVFLRRNTSRLLKKEKMVHELYEVAFNSSQKFHFVYIRVLRG